MAATTHYFLPLSTDGAVSPTKMTIPKLHMSMPTIPSIIPSKLRRKLRAARLSRASSLKNQQRPINFSSSSSSPSITPITYSFNPADTLASLRRHRWTYFDAQYIFLALLFIFSLSIIQTPGPVIKTLFAVGLATLLIIPVTQQFFKPFLPILTWLVLFYACQFITGEYRPGVWVRVLPALENILYGANLSNILSAHKNTVLDVLAWLPYGITHFGAPFVCSGLMFIFGPPGTTPIFAGAFGYMNIIGVLIQLVFPCSPPWYENKYGLAPANYSMPGSPAGLAAIDKLFGIDLYTSTFTASPMVFGAFPSLHSGSATIEALFMSYTFPKLRPLFIAYTLWLWWATMYLSHHYAIDLMAGSFIAAVVYFTAKANFLPRRQHGMMFRWQYEFVEQGEEKNELDQGAGYMMVLDEESFPMTLTRRRESDEWTLGSSSSYSTSSPTKPTNSTRPPSVDWEAETLASASSSDAEVYLKKM